jgi:hypothetical protein
MHAVAFYGHPRLISLGDGAVVHVWEELRSGFQSSSILLGSKASPPALALDATNSRFALANDDEIIVVDVAETLRQMA